MDGGAHGYCGARRRTCPRIVGRIGARGLGMLCSIDCRRAADESRRRPHDAQAPRYPGVGERVWPIAGSGATGAKDTGDSHGRRPDCTRAGAKTDTGPGSWRSAQLALRPPGYILESGNT